MTRTQSPSRPAGVVEPLEWAARTLAGGMLPGLIAGFVVGGLGSRLAMRIMALTSGNARGFETDFGATVGEITIGGTLFLLIAGGVLGMVGGIAYVAIRRLVPGPVWVKGLAFGMLLLALTGRLLVAPDNPDFVILSPAALAVGMFAALPVVYGLLLVPLAKRLEPAIRGVRRPALVIVPVLVGLVPLILLGGLGLLVIAVSTVVWGARKSIGATAKRALYVAGYLILGALVIWRAQAFVSGVAQIL
jgi:hypothetical protein